MADLIDREKLRDALYDADAITFKGLAILNQFPVADAMECNVFRRAINRECARLYHADEEMIKAMAGYNPSSFFAGFRYALDCVVSNLTLLPRERRTDETD